MKTIFKTLLTSALLVLFYLSAATQITNSSGTFLQKEVILETATGSIYGQLMLPNSEAPAALVVIVAGSGPTDMDCNNPMFKTNSYKYLAEDLAKNQIASLRFDKRGIAKSKDAAVSESDLRFENYVVDVVDWIKLMKEDSSFSRIFILGHSEGSLIGMLAAGKIEVAGFISVAGVGKPASEVIREQLKAQPPMVLQDAEPIIESLLAGKTVTEVKPYLNSLFRPSVQPYMISWFKYNPADEIKNLNIPVLIVQGTTDIQVETEHANILHEAAKNSELKVIKGMNHILKDAPADRQLNMATYTQTELPLNALFPGVVEDFIQKNK